MQVERHLAVSPEDAQNPHIRYASLHRTIEKGMATDETWSDLVLVCVELAKHEEAVRAFAKIEGHGLPMRRARGLLVRKKLIKSSSEVARHIEKKVYEEDLRRSLLDEALESVAFLFTDHMPLTLVLATATFPALLGLGGLLGGGSTWIASLFAAIPLLCALGLIGGLGRRVLYESIDGLQDPPAIPGPVDLARDGAAFLRDAAIIGGAAYLPAAAVWHLPGFGFPLSMLFGMVGLTLAPMAFAIRQMRPDDWNSLHPGEVIAAVSAGGVTYLQYVGILGVLAAPAAFANLLMGTADLWLRAAILGPLIVGPMFFGARLLGRVLDMERATLAPFVVLSDQKKTARLRRPTAPAPVHGPQGAVVVTGRKVRPSQAEGRQEGAQAAISRAARDARRRTAARKASTPAPRPIPVERTRRPKARPAAAPAAGERRPSANGTSTKKRRKPRALATAGAAPRAENSRRAAPRPTQQGNRSRRRPS